MTIKTTEKALTTLVAISLIASVIVLSNTTESYAWHDFATPSWGSATHTYKCLSSLDSLADSSVDECDDLQTAADYWNDVANSDWDLTENSSGEVEMSGANLGTGTTIARMTPTTNWYGGFIDAKIEFNNQKDFTDSAQGDEDAFDWQTVAVHEIGHLLKLNHNSETGSPLYSTLDEDVVRRTLTAHDKSVTAGKY